jgi:hypothetical protein
MTEKPRRFEILWKPTLTSGTVQFFRNGTAVFEDPVEIGTMDPMQLMANIWPQDGSWDPEDWTEPPSGAPGTFGGLAEDETLSAFFSHVRYHPLWGVPESFLTGGAPRGLPECEAGSGTFLLPGYLKKQQLVRAIQMSGTGLMTGNASVTAISRASARQIVLSRRANVGSPETGVGSITGLNPGSFLVKDTLVSGGNHPTPTRVNITWSCPSGPFTPPSDPIPAYEFTLEDVGCPVSWPQRFLLRPHDGGVGPTEPSWIETALYDRPGQRVGAQLVGGEVFSWQVQGLKLDVALVDEDQSGALIEVLRSDYGGIDVCEAGFYELPFAE